MSPRSGHPRRQRPGAACLVSLLIFVLIAIPLFARESSSALPLSAACGAVLAATRDTLAPPDTTAHAGSIAIPDTIARPGVQDTVTVLPPIRVEGQRSDSTGRAAATEVRLDRASVIRFLPASTGDALLAVPGVDLVKTGPWASRVSMRGLSGDRVLVLVDGVRVNSVRGHGGQPSLVPLDRLDAVELMPGANSTLFGSDALGGVINLVTHRDLFSTSSAATATVLARAAEPGGARDGTARLRLTTRRLGAEVTGGLSGLEGLVTPGGRVANSGDREQDFAARAAVRLGPGVLDLEHTHHAALDVGLPAFNGGAGSSASYPLQARDAQRLELSTPGRGTLSEARLLAVLQTYRTHFTEDTQADRYFQGHLVATTSTSAADRVRTRSWSVQPQLRLAVLGGVRVTGEARREWTGGPRLTETVVRNSSGAVASDSTERGESVPPAWRTAFSGSVLAAPLEWPVRLELGLRYDELRSHADSTATTPDSRLDVTDRRWSAEGGVSRAVAGVTPYLHVASGFRAPNLDERFFNDDIHGGLRLFGNPVLESERSISYEAGVRASDLWSGRVTSARVSAFRSDVQDLISFRYIGQLYLIPRFQYFNVRRARIEGIEGTARVALGRAAIGVNLSVPRGVDLDSGKRLLDAGTARSTIDLTVSVPRLPQGTLSGRARWNDAVPGADTTLARPAFWAFSLEAASVVAGTRVVLAVQNLLDATYREPLSFIQEPGRTFAISVRRDFELPVPFTGRHP